jgi:hypothetical protein
MEKYAAQIDMKSSSSSGCGGEGVKAESYDMVKDISFTTDAANQSVLGNK